MKELYLGIHGTKQKYLTHINNNGLIRPSSAWFIYKPEDEEKRLRISVFLSLYFSLSLSTLRVIEQKKLTWLEWFTSNVDQVPILVWFPTTNNPSRCQFYNSSFQSHRGESLAYTKVSKSGIVPNFTNFRNTTIESFLNLLELYIEDDKASNLDARFFYNSKTGITRDDLGISVHMEERAARLCAYLEPYYTNLTKQMLSTGGVYIA